MKKFTLILLLLISSQVMAADVTIPTTYQTNGSVTSVNLNGNFTAITSVVNGGLDNDNADTTHGYHFFKSVATLPSAGAQGSVYFLTADNTLNLDTGSAFIKSISTSTSSPAQGDILYYTGSAWADLAAGTSGKFLQTQGAGANPQWATVTNATDLSISGQTAGDIIYFNGSNWIRLAKSATTGTVLQTGTTPSYVNSLASIADYGTSSTTSSAVQGTALKVAYGTASMSGGNVTISNLPYTSQTSFHCTCSRNVDATTSQAINCFEVSASTMKIQDGLGGTNAVNWICMGT